MFVLQLPLNQSWKLYLLALTLTYSKFGKTLTEVKQKLLLRIEFESAFSSLLGWRFTKIMVVIDTTSWLNIWLTTTNHSILWQKLVGLVDVHRAVLTKVKFESNRMKTSIFNKQESRGFIKDWMYTRCTIPCDAKVDYEFFKVALA